MPLPINRVPPGLLSLLDTKSGGVNPLQLSEVLSGSLELLPFYTAANSGLASGNTAATNAVGAVAPTASGNNFRVPNSELWILSYMAVRSAAVLGAATTVKAALCVYDVALGVVTWSEAYQTFTTGERVCVGTNRVLVLGPNDGVGVHFAAYTGVAEVYQFNGQLTRLVI